MIKGRKYIDQQLFQVAGEIIPSIQKEPLKTLGRVCNGSVTDAPAQDDWKRKVDELTKKLSSRC